MPSEPSSDALDAACEAFDNVYEAEIQIGADTYTSNSRQAIAAAIAAYEAAAWSSDMDAVPRESYILVAQMPIGWWTGASVLEDGVMVVHGGSFTPTHWRLPPVLPTPEPVDVE